MFTNKKRTEVNGNPRIPVYQNIKKLYEDQKK